MSSIITNDICTRLAFGLLTCLLASSLGGCGELGRGPFFSVQFQGRTGLIVGEVSYWSRDAGQSWNQMPMGFRCDHEFPCHLPRDLVRLASSSLVVSGLDRLSVRITQDFGESWTIIRQENEVMRGLAWTETGTGLVEADAIWLTRDQGDTWTRCFENQFNVDGAFSGDGNRLLAQVQGVLYGSRDGGDSWRVVFRGGDELPFQLAENQLRTVTATGTVVLVDSDSWRVELLSPIEDLGDFLGGYAFFEDRVAAISAQSVYVGDVTEHGVSWVRHDFPVECCLEAIATSPLGELFVVGGRYAGILTPAAAFAYETSNLHDWAAVDLP